MILTCGLSVFLESEGWKCLLRLDILERAEEEEEGEDAIVLLIRLGGGG